MKLFLPPQKSADIRSLLQNFLQLTKTPAKHLAKVLGKVVSCISSHGPYARVCTRSGYADLQSTVDKFGWGASVLISENTKRELNLFLDVLGPHNGHTFAHHLTDLRVETIFANPHCKVDAIVRPKFGYNAVIASDASDFKVSCQWLEGPHTGDLSFTLSEVEQAASSGQRELLAMLKALRHFKETLQLRKINFIWATDSENLVSFITKGSSKQHIHALIMEVYHLCHDMDCTVDPVHLRRCDDRISEVDRLSKIRDTDNWSIDTFSFNELKNEFGLTMDVFADSSNKRLPLFMSKNFEAGTQAVDAFSAPWQGVVWLCPPTSLLARVAKRIRNSKTRGLVIVPNWPASDFYNEYLDQHKQPKSPFHLVKEFHPFILQNELARNTPLYGITKFSFFVFSFDTNVQE